MEYAEIDVDILDETDDAYKVSDGDVECWIPKSHISDTEERRDVITSITIPEWLAIEKDLV